MGKGCQEWRQQDNYPTAKIISRGARARAYTHTQLELCVFALFSVLSRPLERRVYATTLIIVKNKSPNDKWRQREKKEQYLSFD